MVSEISYNTLANVMDSWEMMRRIDNYRVDAGVELFRRYFALEPRAAAVFAFGKDAKFDDEFYKSPRLRRHAAHYMDMVDRAVNLLGPDFELLTDIMMDLGAQHYKFGVEPSFYPPMGQALLLVMHKFLGDHFTQEMKDSWLEVYQALALDMIRAKSR
eukprot:Nitzschia sp. Nitz4//scaffold5_size260463//32982//33533//NITZ4_000944-RA/size260463-augustus-gene-0.0-mRNA-1//1//CDS//3329555226//3171//frame0